MKGPMSAAAFNRSMIRALKGRADVTLTWHTLRYGKHGRKCYRVLRIASRDIKRNDKVLLLTTGMHGDEPVGPLFVLRRINWIINAAHKRGVKVIIYALMNPSGFELGTKYNLFGDKPLERGNNDLVVYRDRNGNIVSDLGTRDTSRLWFLSRDGRLGIKPPPQEAKLMHRLLKNDFWNFPGQIKGALDLHNGNDDDDLLMKVPPGAFHYAFVKHVFKPIVRRVACVMLILRNRNVSDGFERTCDNRVQTRIMRTDEDGGIRHYDGSMTDLLWRLGVPYAVNVDTTTGLPRRKTMQLYTIWVEGMINLIRKHN